MGMKRWNQQRRPNVTKLRAFAKAYRLRIEPVEGIPGDYWVKRGSPTQPEYRELPLPRQVIGQYRLDEWPGILRDIATLGDAPWMTPDTQPCEDHVMTDDYCY